MSKFFDWSQSLFLTRDRLSQNIKKQSLETYWRRSSAGPPFNTSLTAIDGSPVTKCGLSRPPETAMPAEIAFWVTKSNQQISQLTVNFIFITYQIQSQLHELPISCDIPMMFGRPKNERNFDFNKKKVEFLSQICRILVRQKKLRM